DWRARFDERAGFLEHDCGLLPVEAEVQAFEHCIVEWLNANPVQSLAGRCAWCGKVETRSIKVVPFGAGEHHAWLHAYCWPAWHQLRRAEATAALRTMGIALRGSFGEHDDGWRVPAFPCRTYAPLPHAPPEWPCVHHGRTPRRRNCRAYFVRIVGMDQR